MKRSVGWRRQREMAAVSRSLTKRFTSVELKHKLYVAQKRRSAGFEALKM